VNVRFKELLERGHPDIGLTDRALNIKDAAIEAEFRTEDLRVKLTYLANFAGLRIGNQN
jgi:hypothetical protein